jgi:hypothetical protein
LLELATGGVRRGEGRGLRASPCHGSSRLRRTASPRSHVSPIR